MREWSGYAGISGGAGMPGDAGIFGKARLPGRCGNRRKNANAGKSGNSRDVPQHQGSGVTWRSHPEKAPGAGDPRKAPGPISPPPLEVGFVAEGRLGDSCSPQEQHPRSRSCTESEMSLSEQPHKPKISGLPNMGWCCWGILQRK